MGSDSSKQTRSLGGPKALSLKESFTKKSNFINQRLSDFFGPIEGFKLSSTSVPSLEKYNDPTFRVLSKENMKRIKEERHVCSNLIISYTDSLNGLLEDSEFRKKVERFVSNMEIRPEKVGKISVRLLKSINNDDICNDVINYYFLKYRVFRLIHDFDPYEKEFEFITNSLQNSSKYSQLEDYKQEIGKIKYSQLVKARNEYQMFVSEYINRLNRDDLTYPELEELYSKLISNSSIARYCQATYNICDDVENFLTTKDLKSFNFRDLSYDYEICRNINLSNIRSTDSTLRWSPCSKFKKSYSPRKDSYRPVGLLGKGKRKLYDDSDSYEKSDTGYLARLKNKLMKDID
jgi:hypothetical protein